MLTIALNLSLRNQFIGTAINKALNTVWLPAAVFLAAAAAEIFLSTAAPNYANQALKVHGLTLFSLAVSCWILAAALVLFPPLREGAFLHLNALSSTGRWKNLWPFLACAGFTTVIGFIKFCQYRGFQLPEDTTLISQAAFNTLHGRWLDSTVMGVNVLSLHFAFTLGLLSPVLLIWRSTLALLLLQCIALGSTGLAAYYLAEYIAASSFAGFVAMLLVYSQPYFHNMITASLDNSLFYAPLTLWGLYFLERRSWALSLSALSLAATTREHFPFTLAGLGLYAIVRNGKPTFGSWMRGGAVVALAVVLWFAEMRVVNSFPRGWGTTLWAYFTKYGSTREEIICFVLRHPLSALAKTLYPFQRELPLLKLILYSAFLPLAAPLHSIPFLVAIVPLLMASDGGLHDLGAHYPALVFGTLMFAVAHGIARVYRWAGEPRKQGYFLAFVLLIGGFGFKNSPNPLLPDWRLHMFDATPRVIAQVPPDASLWTDEYLAPWVACRAQLKLLAYPGMAQYFKRGLFRPAYLLVQKGWIVQTEPEIRDAIVSFLADNRYVKIEDAPDLILLKDPRQAASAVSPPLSLAAPADEIKIAIREVLARLLMRERGVAPPPLPPLTKKQTKMADYVQYLLLKNGRRPGPTLGRPGSR